MILVFLEFSRASNTLHHIIFLEKWKTIRGDMLRGLKSSSTNRTQYVYVNNVDSEARSISAEVYRRAPSSATFFFYYGFNVITACSRDLDIHFAVCCGEPRAGSNGKAAEVQWIITKYQYNFLNDFF